MSQTVRNFSNPDSSLFHHGLIKIILQFQLSAKGKSWDEFLVDCQLGPMQYWPNPSPRTRRKRKVINSGVNSTSENISEVKGFENASMPINKGINENDDRDSVPCSSKEVLDKPLSGKSDSIPAKIEEGLTKGEVDNNVECKNSFETNKPDECNRESMHRLDHLAQICCDKEGLGFENLSFSRRVTRSMHNIHSISGYKVDQQAAKPAVAKTVVVNIEDDIPSSVPNTMNANNPAFTQGSDAKSDEAEGNQPGVNRNVADPKLSYSQHCDSPHSPQVSNEDETLQHVLGNVYQDKITEFKGKLKHCLSSTTLLEEENKTFRKELLEWIDR